MLQGQMNLYKLDETAQNQSIYMYVPINTHTYRQSMLQGQIKSEASTIITVYQKSPDLISLIPKFSPQQ